MDKMPEKYGRGAKQGPIDVSVEQMGSPRDRETPAGGASAAAKAARPRAPNFARGTNQSGVRLYNERLVLSLIRRYGNAPRAEIARQTGLSAQTIAVIMRQLEADGLVTKQDPQRGRVGQPSVPFALNPDGAFSLGLKIGRRVNDLVLIDFLGSVRRDTHFGGSYPTPDDVLGFVNAGFAELAATLTPEQERRVAGLGIAAPFELWNWEAQIGAPRAVLEQWRTFDLKENIQRICPWPVYFTNDATAACAAELTFGNPEQHSDFLYFFIGSFIGGGIVLNGLLVAGRTGNAGALGSMPVATRGADGQPVTQQLIRSASLYLLANRLTEIGRDAAILWRSPDDWGDLGTVVDTWIEEAAVGIAFAIVAAISVMDFPAVIIDGAFPVDIRRRMVDRVNARLRGFDRQGLSPVTAIEGVIGSGARAIGGACLPLLANFARDREVLFKEALSAG
jgi:predicted NBD/HSP70 family sugar kinase/biotin operon repressor